MSRIVVALGGNALEKPGDDAAVMNIDRIIETARMLFQHAGCSSRRRWDSNPCTGCPMTAFRVRLVMTTSIRLRMAAFFAAVLF